MYTEGWLKNQLYLHNSACDLPVLCRESPGLERSLETMECQQHQQLPVLSVPPSWGQRAAGCPWQQCLLPCLCVYIDNGGQLSPSFGAFLNQIMQAETKGEISACGGTVERGEFVPNTHNETSQWPEQGCDTDTAGQYRGAQSSVQRHSLHTSSCKSDQTW